MQCQDNVSTGRTAEESLFVLVRLFKLGPYEETFIIEYDRGHCGQVAISEVVKSARRRVSGGGKHRQAFTVTWFT